MTLSYKAGMAAKSNSGGLSPITLISDLTMSFPGHRRKSLIAFAFRSKDA